MAGGNVLKILGIITFVALVVLAGRTWVKLFNDDRSKFVKVSAFVAILVALFTAAGVGFGDLGDAFTGEKFDRVLDMLGTVLISVLACIGLWVLSNKLVGTLRFGWNVFVGIAGALIGAAFFGVLRGNRAVFPILAERDPIELLSGSGLLGNAEWPIVGALVFGLGGFAMRSAARREIRLLIAAATGLIIGYLIAHYVKLWHRPNIDWVATIIATLVGAGVGTALRLRRSDRIPGVLMGAGFGFAIGAWMLSPWQGTQSPWVAALAPPLLIALGVAWSPEPTPRTVGYFENRARATAFLAPAMLFLLISLVIPALRTGLLSFKDRRSTEWVGVENYSTLFSDPKSFDVSEWSNLFTSNLFILAIITLLAGVLLGFLNGWRRNGSPGFEATPASSTGLLIAAFLFVSASMAVLRGTFFNNLWWVVTVVSVATVAGLLIAVLADRATIGEKAAKSMIFMPMAISFVGASIVWRLQYQARPPSKNQTGVLNAVWVALGRLAHSGTARIVVLVILGAIIVALAARAIPRARQGLPFVGSAIGVILLGYLFFRLADRRIGGYSINAAGETDPDTVLFLTNQPFNNVFLMIIMIWMQTGFAMVILSAAIKAVPTELLESAKVDGATESQSFYNVTLPQIIPTLGVVITTMIVQVTKVYDIVKVAGQGGRFGNNVLANEMFEQSFAFGNFGLGSAIAVVMFLTVLPVMIYNIRSMQKAQL